MTNFADIIVAPVGGAVFSNTRKGDLAIFTESSNQHIHIGPATSAHSTLSVSQYAVHVGKSIIPMENEVYDLGSLTARFHDLFLAGSTIHLGDTQLSTNATGGFEVRNNSNQPFVVFNKPEVASSKYFVFDAQAGKIQIFNPDTQVVTSASGGLEGLSNSDGAVFTLPGSNLGIGTSIPQSLLHVAGDARIDGDLNFYDVNENIVTQINEDGMIVRRRLRIT